MTMNEIFRIWGLLKFVEEISITKDKKVNLYDKDKKLLMSVPLAIFEKIQGEKNVV
ncbi:hypothetical protein [Psychrilyobacter atlanticus]|uniref:hypothetical protein n=1 Tax=Psychrilyobacter atlanticus TaxID=271091 RepID=UPI000404A673|nr:hypothetical protein [Psychrilyobacter atlanticus]